MYDIYEVAKLTGFAVRTVQKHAKINGIPKHGRDYIFDDDQVQLIASSVRRRPAASS